MGTNRQKWWWACLAVLLAGGIGGGGYRLAETVGSARASVRSLARLERQWRKSAAPTAAQTRAGEADLAAAEKTRAGLLEQLGPGAPPSVSGGPPPTRMEAFFQLSGFVRNLHELATRAGLGVRPDEQFGFSAYRNEAPPAEAYAAIARQQRVVSELIAALAAARPRQLLALQRTRPSGIGRPAADVAPAGEKAGAGDSDYFVLEPRLSVAARDLIATDAYRLTFVGRTPALRQFLNALAASALPVLVRGVAAEPAPSGNARRSPPGAGDAPILVARSEETRFTVIVEAYQTVAPAVPQAGAAPAAWPAPASWSPPPAQHRGPGWIYELFAPPSLYFDPRSRTLGAGLAPEGGLAAKAEFDLELVQVRGDRFRWQLVGYSAGAGALRGIFADAESGATVLAGIGDRLGDTGWTVRGLTIDRPEGMPTDETPAVATVGDGTSGAPVVLSTREPCDAGAPLGLFASRRSPAFRRTLKAGDSLELNGASYRVEELGLRPPQAVVARLAPGEDEPLIVALTPTSPARADRAETAPRRFADSP